MYFKAAIGIGLQNIPTSHKKPVGIPNIIPIAMGSPIARAAVEIGF